MFHRLAGYYDRLVEGKDYPAEVARLRELARRYGTSGGRAWLDVGCGTGRHLELLRRYYDVAGVDASGPMLRVARSRLPGVPLRRAEMRAFRFGRPFDVVSCLFGPVGHLPNQRELARAFGNFARHLKPGGVALVEPWLEPVDFRPGFVHLMSHAEPGMAVVRLSRTSRRGDHSITVCHYLVGTSGRAVRHWAETDVTLMVPRDRLLDLMRGAGLRPRFLRRGVRAGRGLLVGVKPPA